MTSGVRQEQKGVNLCRETLFIRYSREEGKARNKDLGEYLPPIKTSTWGPQAHSRYSLGDFLSRREVFLLPTKWAQCG